MNRHIGHKTILFCDGNIDGTIGGSYYSLYYLVDGIDKRLYKPIVVFYKDNPLVTVLRNEGIVTKILKPPEPTHFKRFKKHPFCFFNSTIGLLQSSINFFRFLILQTIKFTFFLKKNHVNLVHLNNSVAQGHSWILAASLTGTRCISHERSAKPTYSKLSRYFASRLDAVICISDSIKRKMEKSGINNKNLVTIYNGLDPNRFLVRCDADTIRSRYQIEHQVPLVGIVGNIKSWKGQDVVVRAIAEVKQLYPNIKCLIIGDTANSDRSYLHTVEQLIRELNISANVIFTGFQLNIPDYVNALDIVLHASTLGEPFGRVLLEAMALEKPLIGSRGGAVPEIIDEPRTGLMFEPGNHHDLARSIIQLLDNRDMGKEMGKKGRARLIKHFHISKNLEHTQQLYRSLLFDTTSSTVSKFPTPSTSGNRLPRI